MNFMHKFEKFQFPAYLGKICVCVWGDVLMSCFKRFCLPCCCLAASFIMCLYFFRKEGVSISYIKRWQERWYTRTWHTHTQDIHNKTYRKCKYSCLMSLLRPLTPGNIQQTTALCAAASTVPCAVCTTPSAPKRHRRPACQENQPRLQLRR